MVNIVEKPMEFCAVLMPLKYDTGLREYNYNSNTTFYDRETKTWLVIIHFLYYGGEMDIGIVDIPCMVRDIEAVAKQYKLSRIARKIDVIKALKDWESYDRA